MANKTTIRTPKGSGSMTIEPANPKSRVVDATKPKSEVIPAPKKAGMPLASISALKNPGPAARKATPTPVRPGEWTRPAYTGVTKT